MATGNAVGSGGAGAAPAWAVELPWAAAKAGGAGGAMGAVLLRGGCGCTAVLPVPQEPAFASPLDTPLPRKVKCGMV